MWLVRSFAVGCAAFLVMGIESCSYFTEHLEESGSEQLSVASEGVRLNILPSLPKQEISLIDLTDTSRTLLPLRRDSQPFLDIRAVGDSGWTGNKAVTPPNAQIGTALKAFSPNGLLLEGDLGVINWETVVGSRCDSYGEGFGFLTAPQAVRQAFQAGFQIFGLSNNHARDCNSTPEAGGFAADGAAGEIATALNMKNLESELGLIWNGVNASSAKKFVTRRVLNLNGRSVQVAFASIDLGRENCLRSLCYGDRSTVAAQMKDVEADMKIVSMHSREWLAGVGVEANKQQLNKLLSTGKLMVENGDVDLVFGTGPHIAMPVRVLKKPQGGTGVVFLSLGNFIHPLLSSQSPNLVGRVLFDLDRKVPVQVQAIRVGTSGSSAAAVDFDASSPFVGGSPWKIGNDPSTGIDVGYFNIK